MFSGFSTCPTQENVIGYGKTIQRGGKLECQKDARSQVNKMKLKVLMTYYLRPKTAPGRAWAP